MRRNKPPRLAYLFLTFTFIFLIGFLIVSNWNIHKKRSKFNRGLKTLEGNLEKAEKRNQELKAKIADVSDKDYIERVAREKFGLKKPGEEVVVIKREKAKPVPETKKEESKFSFQRWIEPFKKFWQKISR